MSIEVEDILEVLPQTQCGDCGFAGCRPYAQAIVSGRAPINQCPPGGLSTLQALGELTHQDTASLKEALFIRLTSPVVAKIREPECIGCMKCVHACPVDAIIGAPKMMHVVLQADCTGCGLCVVPCPVDCIDLIPVSELHFDKRKARQRYEAKEKRGAFRRAGRNSEVTEQTAPLSDKKRFIAEAVLRAKRKKQK